MKEAALEGPVVNRYSLFALEGDEFGTIIGAQQKSVPSHVLGSQCIREFLIEDGQVGSCF